MFRSGIVQLGGGKVGLDEGRKGWMRRSGKLLLAGLAMFALPMPAAAIAPDVCGAIARISAAARERPAFASLRRALAAEQTVVPGFAAGECEVAADGIECNEMRSGSAFDNWPDLATCAGVIAYEPRPRPIRFRSNRSYRLGRFVLSRGVYCPGCAAVGPSFFIMRFERPEERRQ